MNISNLNSIGYTSITRNSYRADATTEPEAAASWQQMAATRMLETIDDDDTKQQQTVQLHVAVNSAAIAVNSRDENMTSSDSEIQAMMSHNTKSVSKQAEQRNSAGDSEQQSVSNVENKAESLLNKLFEQLLANRLGIDKKRMDDIKDKLKELEKLKQELSKADEHTPAIKKQLQLIDEQMLKLKEELEALVKQATERLTQQTEDETATKRG